AVGARSVDGRIVAAGRGFLAATAGHREGEYKSRSLHRHHVLARRVPQLRPRGIVAMRAHARCTPVASPRCMRSALTVAAIVTDGLLAGASLNRSVVELPAFRHMGAAAWADYSRNADLRNGKFWYPALAIGGTLLTIAAATRRRSLWPSALLATAGLLSTALAGPNVLRVQRTNDRDVIERSFAGFSRWQAVR